MGKESAGSRSTGKRRSAAKQKFDPNRLDFKQGIDRIQKVLAKYPLKKGQVVTSRDEIARNAMDALEVDNVPSGFQKWQLPVHLACESQMYVTVAQPGATAPRHAHRGGDGIRFIAGGSIIYKNQELTAGDWMFIPQGAEYSFVTGRFGAIMAYCYCCSCA